MSIQTCSTRLTALWLLALALATGCADATEPDEEPASDEQVIAELEALAAASAADDTEIGDAVLDGKADRASSIYHECITATYSGSTKWTYKTNFINNTRGTIEVYVYQYSGGTARAFGPLRLNKIGTDLWKEPSGKMTARLVQKGAGKSIRVFHNSVNLLASEANGWCKTVDPLSSISLESQHDFFWSGRGILNGTWRFLAVDNQLVDAETPYGLSFEERWQNNPEKPSYGTMGSYRRCNPIATHYYTPPAGSRTPTQYVRPGSRVPSVFGAIQLAFDLIGIGFQAAELYTCRNNENMLIPTTSAYTGYLWERGGDLGVFRNRPHLPASFLQACGTGDKTYFVEPANGSGGSDSVLCIQVFDTGVGEAYIRTRGVNIRSREQTDWAILVRD